MPTISWNEIQDRATEFASKWEGESYEKGESQSFWSDFLHIFDIDRRRHGAFFEYAIKKGSGQQGFIDMFWPGKLLAEQKSGGKDLSKASIQAYEYLETMPDHDLPHAIVLSDFASFVVINLDTREQVEFKLDDLHKHVKLFGFLIEQESKRYAESNPVNIKAAEAMANLHNQLRDDNYTGHDLEVLLVRMVFCMFADDSGIFDHQTLLDYIQNRTSDDGSDLGPRLMQVFQALNTPRDQRQSSLDESIASLPYVNGGLFAESIRTPYFTSQMRRDIIAAMSLDWSKVSPAIFGSMFQGVMDEKQRRNLGAHYTSEKNILRVIKPLFLDDLYKEFAECLTAGPRKKYDELRKFQDKLADLKFLDPACGCGNFLVITYRELRRLEHKVVAQLAKNADQQDMLATHGEGVGTLKVNVDQMYGIEIEEFPSLIAQTALWLTDHQMNIEYSHESGRTFKRLPLTVSATIVNRDALSFEWRYVFPVEKLSYILGNPPFIGAAFNTKAGRSVAHEKPDLVRHLKLDFVASWFFHSAVLMGINPSIKTAFVATNSITQGEQPALLWREAMDIFDINFAHRTFRWTNDARGAAAVHCVIIGFSIKENQVQKKRLFEYPDINGEPIEKQVDHINGYLLPTQDILVSSRKQPISDVPPMKRGNSPYDGGNFLFDEAGYLNFIGQEPEAKKYFKKFIGAKEYLDNDKKYCLWLLDANPSDLKSLPKVIDTVRKVKDFRENAKGEETRQYATTPTTFRDKNAPTTFLVVPRVSSERREYIPIGFYNSDYIPGDTVMIVPNASFYHFGILTSRIHMAWMRVVAGRLKSDYRYSKDIVYNNFIWPDITDEQKAEIEKLAQNVLDARAEFPDSSLADLYDPLTMPPTLAKAHTALDKAVDRLYLKEPFATDADRVALLFKRYQDISNGSDN